jgi:hypothetical protein
MKGDEMRNGRRYAWVLAALLAASPAIGHDEDRTAARADRIDKTAPSWLERGFARLERAIARLEARFSGRGGSMGGCEDMMAGGMTGGGMMDGGMMGGGMMGGPRPNERWRGPAERR